MRRTLTLATIVPVALFLAACSDNGDSAGSTTVDEETASAEPSDDQTAGSEASTDDTTTDDDTTGDDTTDDDTTDDETTDDAGTLDVVAGEPFPEERCAANQAAGTINYFSGFDYAAAASILEVVVADERGYFDDLCLDVEITPGFATANYPLVAAGEAQFSSAGSFSELATQAVSNDAEFVALSTDGHVAIEVLMVKPDMITSLDDMSGATMGIKGAVPPAIAVMLQQEAGLVEGDDYDTVLLDGFDPIAHWSIEDVAAVPGWRSNEPGALERAGETIEVYDPGDVGIPGSFGLIYTSRSFMDEHPTAVEDFMRASMFALAEAVSDPDAAAAIAVERINAGGNPNFLSPEGEAFRWTTDAQAIVDTTPSGSNFGVPIPEELESQIAAYDAVGVYGDDGAPAIDGLFDAGLVAGLYADDGSVIWPS